MGMIKSFKELEIWKRGIGLVQQVYKLTEGFPESELYGLTVQMRRSAVSIPSNIAEGFKRGHAKEFKQFLHVAHGSLAELETQVVIAQTLHYLDSKSYDRLSEEVDHLSRMITNLVKKL